MAYYGEWIDPPLHEETLTIPAGLGTLLTRTSATDKFSGWRFSPTSNTAVPTSSFVAMDAEVLFPADPTPIPSLSAAAFANMRAETVSLGATGAKQEASLTHHEGGHTYDPVADVYTQSEGWTQDAIEFRMWHSPVTGDWRPDTWEWPEGAVGVEYEDFEDHPPVELTSVEVLPDGSLGDFARPIKPPGHTDPTWLALSGATEGSLDDLLAYPDTRDGYTLPADQLAAMQALMRGLPGQGPVIGSHPDVPKLPRFAVTYGGDWPGLYAPHTGRVDVNLSGLSLRLRFRTRRYRFVYDEPPVTLLYTPAPRRIYPRDDGLTGGARRTWPPSKTYQRGNRVDGSGYL